MNERIRELAEQADIKFSAHWQHQGIDTAVIIPSDLKKFAELIVKECMTVARKADGLDAEYEAWYLIKQHFGLEETRGWVCPKCGIDRTKDVCPNGHMAAIEGKCPMTMEAQ